MFWAWGSAALTICCLVLRKLRNSAPVVSLANGGGNSGHPLSLTWVMCKEIFQQTEGKQWWCTSRSPVRTRQIHAEKKYFLKEEGRRWCFQGCSAFSIIWRSLSWLWIAKKNSTSSRIPEGRVTVTPPSTEICSWQHTTVRQEMLSNSQKGQSQVKTQKNYRLVSPSFAAQTPCITGFQLRFLPTTHSWPGLEQNDLFHPCGGNNLFFAQFNLAPGAQLLSLE